MLAKLSCQVYKLLPVQFIKKDKETKNYWLTDVMTQAQNDKKNHSITHYCQTNTLYKKNPFKYLYTCYHVILLIKPMVY